jgi:regulator of cell morphogenesis and NO signaling
MYFSQKTYIKPEMKLLDLLNENHALLLFLEHFEVDFSVHDKTVKQVCTENHLGLQEFLIIGNLYNGYYPGNEDIELLKDIPTLLKYLKNSHRFYKNDKYPELKKCLKTLHENHKTKDIEMLEKFFDDYFQEVVDHLDYEEKVAYPYFIQLFDFENNPEGGKDFSGDEYLEHHTDIETKLSDLKSLMLKHINISGDLSIRRKFLINLFDLESDLKIHSMVEEMILLPLAKKIEQARKIG